MYTTVVHSILTYTVLLAGGTVQRRAALFGRHDQSYPLLGSRYKNIAEDEQNNGQDLCSWHPLSRGNLLVLLNSR